LLSADYDRTAYVWNARTGERLQTLRHGEGRSPRELVILTATGGVLGAAFRPPADSQLVTSCGDGTVAFWDANTGEGLGRLPDVHQHMVHDVAVSSDGKWVLTACHDKNARLWDFDSRELVATLKHDTQVVTAAFRGNDQVVTGDADGNVILWRIQDALAEDDKTLEYSAGQEVAQWHHLGTVHRLRVSADGSRILSASFDNTARLWDPERDVAVGPAFEHQAAVWAVAFSPDGRIATACDDNVVRVWRPAPGQSVREVQHEMGFDHAAIFSPDGRYVLLKIDEEFASVYEAETEARLCTLRHPGGIRAFAVSPDRSRILTGGADGTCRVWDVPGNAPAFDAFRHGNGVWSVAISPDGSRALTGAFDGMVQLTNMRTGKPLRSPLAIGARVQGVAFGPGGSRFGIGGADKRAYIYSTGDENPRVVLRGHHSAVFAISFSRDGTRVATGSHDNTVRVWDTATGRPVSEPLRHPGPICYAVGTALSPDGSTVATACEDGTVRVWDIATSRPIGPALRHPARVLMVAFANDTEIRTGTATGTVRFWDAERTPIRGDVERIKMWVEVITGFELGDDGTLRALDGASWKERRDRLRKLGGPPLRP
jgi:WD40 repeat protein